MPDTFDEVGGEQVLVKDGSKGSYVHIRIQQRNGRKSLTTVQGLAIDLDLKKILKALKKTYSTNGTILVDDEVGEVIQLQGQTTIHMTGRMAERSGCGGGWRHHSASRIGGLVASRGIRHCAAIAPPLSRSTISPTVCRLCVLSFARAGDQRKNVYEFLTKCNILGKNEVKVHGF